MLNLVQKNYTDISLSTSILQYICGVKRRNETNKQTKNKQIA